MKSLKLVALLFFTVMLVLPAIRTSIVKGYFVSLAGQGTVSVDCDPTASITPQCIPQEAATAFDDRSINLNFVSDEKHHEDQAAFDTFEQIPDGLGPIYNAQSCRECHQNTVSGAISQVRELRAGVATNDPNNTDDPCVLIHDDNGNKVLICNRSLINLRAICPAGPLKFTVVPTPAPHEFSHPNANIQERVDNITDANADPIDESKIVVSLRTSLNTFGDGLVECVNSNTLQKISNNQPIAQRGKLIKVPVLESPQLNNLRVGRFGWKTQHASLLSFSSDAYLNEMGITNRLAPNNVEVTSICDEFPANPADIEDDANDIDAFARFMRATKAPPRAPNSEISPTPDALIAKGSELFDNIGCAVCHVRTITTAAVGTVLNCGTFTVPQGLGCRIFHPFGDFLLHDIGIPDVTQGEAAANVTRTAPLWGVRTRAELMHDGLSRTFVDAIKRHRVQGQASNNAFFALTDDDKRKVIAFLKSL
jgi:CxxC motif-containing protein (DUF1111 family)